jgi:hypothetical protein
MEAEEDPVRTLAPGELLGKKTAQDLKELVYDGQIVDRETEDDYAT